MMCPPRGGGLSQTFLVMVYGLMRNAGVGDRLGWRSWQFGMVNNPECVSTWWAFRTEVSRHRTLAVCPSRGGRPLSEAGMGIPNMLVLCHL